MLYLVDLEPLEQRYTKQWQTWIPEMIYESDSSIKYTTIFGTPRGFKTGEFLDINRTNMYKADQVQKIAELFDSGVIKNGDSFLFYDGYHFGLTALKYMAQLQDIQINIYTIWHAGSYDSWDFTAQKGLESWSEDQENSWFEISDKIFVATEYHKRLIFSNRNVSENKIKVTGLPFKFDYIKRYDTSNKENIIVFPHRKAPEKNLDLFLSLAKELPQWKFIVTMDETNNKDEYYSLLAKSKISFSANLQETWGIGTFEAMSLGNAVVVPDRLSYQEMYFSCFKYDDMVDPKEMIVHIMNNFDSYKPKVFENFNLIRTNFSEQSIERMLKEMDV